MITKSRINKLIEVAILEDAARRDCTTTTVISPRKKCSAIIFVKEPAIICGMDFAKGVFKKMDKNISFKPCVRDGQYVKKNSTLLTLNGRAQPILSGERIAINFLGYLSGIATQTHHYTQKLKPYKTVLLDTRKTTPSLRKLERYAVRVGGGTNHRTNLQEMIFIKDNHRAAFEKPMAVREIIQKAHRKSRKKVEMEVDNFAEFKEALKEMPDYILLDNMNVRHIRKAVEFRNKAKLSKKIQLEASGGITIKNIEAYAKTGVERISIGALTHSPKNIDISLEIIH